MGIFNRSTKGHVTPPIEVTLERGPLAFFSETIGETDPIYFDSDAAQAAGCPFYTSPSPRD